MKKLFIFINTNPSNIYFYKKNIIDLKKNKKWNVKFWNLLKIENKKLHEIFFKRKGNRIIHDKNIINFKNIFNLKKEFDKLPSTFFYFNGAAKNYKILIIDRLLKVYGGKKVYIEDNGNRPARRNFKQNLNFILKNFDKYIFVKILKYPKILINKFIKFKIILPSFDIFFVPNKVLYKVIASKEDPSKIRKIHDYDYERFLKLNKKKKKKDFILFIDQAMDANFENKIITGAERTYDEKEYWPKIEKFLSYIKVISNKKPIVAGAQRRNIYDLPIKNKFFFDKTPELIRDSKLVITHDSTALHLAILFKKPIILLTLDIFSKVKHVTDLTIKKFSRELGAKVINLDHFSYSKKNFNLKSFLKVDERKYNNYINKYLRFKNLKENNSRWNIILKELDKIKI